jgi:hypothetical protein
MRGRLLSGLLVLSLLTTWVDDLVAAATPDPSDDIQATENNHYLGTAKPYRPESLSWELACPSALPASPPTALSLADLRHSCQVTPHFATGGTALLYRLSFLRR